MLRLLLGLIKGAFVGGLVGVGAYALNLTGAFHWITYGFVGAVVGLLVGRPFWSHLFDKGSTIFVSVLKALVGFGVGVGVYAIVAKAWGGFSLDLAGEVRNVFDWQYIMGAAIGALYGAWVEIDDAPKKEVGDASAKA